MKEEQDQRIKAAYCEIENILDTINSLNTSLLEAGGTPFSLEKLKATTVYELIRRSIAPNKIRFRYIENL